MKSVKCCPFFLLVKIFNNSAQLIPILANPLNSAVEFWDLQYARQGKLCLIVQVFWCDLTRASKQLAAREASSQSQLSTSVWE